MPTYNFSSTNFSISFVNGNGIYYNTTRLSEEDVTNSSIDSQEQDYTKSSLRGRELFVLPSLIFSPFLS